MFTFSTHTKKKMSEKYKSYIMFNLLYTKR